MKFRDQIGWTALIGLGSLGAGMMVWLGSQAMSVPSDSWFITAAWVLVGSGVYLLLMAASRAGGKRVRTRIGWLHPFATWGPINRWYYWVDRSGKDRDA